MLAYQSVMVLPYHHHLFSHEICDIWSFFYLIDKVQKIIHMWGCDCNSSRRLSLTPIYMWGRIGEFYAVFYHFPNKIQNCKKITFWQKFCLTPIFVHIYVEGFMLNFRTIALIIKKNTRLCHWKIIGVRSQLSEYCCDQWLNNNILDYIITWIFNINLTLSPSSVRYDPQAWLLRATLSWGRVSASPVLV